MSNDRQTLLFAGQQNAGKSTLFNCLTGARQHVANYPGVTVDKKMGLSTLNGQRYLCIDLPGTYSLTSYSLEERVARQALQDNFDATVLNIIDANQLNRGLHLTLQLIERGHHIAVALNMMDVATKSGLDIDCQVLAQSLNVPVVSCNGRQRRSKQVIADVVGQAAKSDFQVAYGPLEAWLNQLELQLKNNFENHSHQNPAVTTRWLALRFLERDDEVEQQLKSSLSHTSYQTLESLRQQAQIDIGEQTPLSDFIASRRQQTIQQLLAQCVKQTKATRHQISRWIDKFVLNRFLAPLFLLGTVFIIYQSAIVWGYSLTNDWWPYLAKLRAFVASILPEAGLIHDPYLRALGLWVMDSANTLLNYLPIFLILFAMIAILEDSGYMARIAFICDRLLHKFGLHGQSTLPYILAGVFAGGCAVPGVMATKGIPDNRARLATILTVPFMNCLAKVPLYTLLISTFFVEDKALMMFYIATISMIAALLVAKLLTATVLKKSETAPFVMELPRYHLPTVRSVLTRALERTWIYLRKVGTIVLAVSTVIFMLLQFPGIPEAQEKIFITRAEKAVTKFERVLNKSEHGEQIQRQQIPALINFYNDYKAAKLNAKGKEASQAVNHKFAKRNTEFYAIVVPEKGDKSARNVNRALRKLASERNKIRRDIKEIRLENSVLGRFGRSLEPITQFAGFDWKINIALFSSFAARESSVATLGVLFQNDDAGEGKKLEERMSESSELTNHGALTAVALTLFFILYPPCLATVMIIRVQTGQYRWMWLSIILPTVIGFAVATGVYQIGSRFNLSAITMMSAVYFSGLAMLLFLALPWRREKKMISQECAHV